MIFETLKRYIIKKRIESGKIPRGRVFPVEKKVRIKDKKPSGRNDGVLSFSASLGAKFIGKDGSEKDYGIVSRKKVTTAFVAYLVDSLQDSASYPMSNFKYHDSGTGVTAEANTQTALITPCGEARDVGTQIEGATANIYKTVATHTYAGSFAITEHGLFSASASGTMMDRSLFSAINVTAGDSIQYTYELTANAES